MVPHVLILFFFLLSLSAHVLIQSSPEQQGLENGQKYLGGAQYERLNEWKKYYAWKAGFGHWRWQIENTEDNYNLHVSEDRLTCSLPPQKATHANAWGEFGWNKGIFSYMLPHIS